MESNVFIVVGITYGDEGKGTTVDYLTKVKDADLIVRFNGGPQAAHFVVKDDGGVHCFAQFGAGTFQSEKVKTLHSRFMLVEPTRMQNEASYLEDLEVENPLSRIYMDLDAYVITPYHILINHMWEKQRGDGKHGSCGMGIGITAMEAFDHLRFYLNTEEPIHCLQVKDWLSPALKSKLELISAQKVAQARAIIAETKKPETQNILKEHLEKFISENTVDELALTYEQFVNTVGLDHLVDGKKFLQNYLEKGQTVVFEGSQGALLDTDFGFFPFNTATCCTPKNALTLLAETGIKHNCLKVGAIRSYSHRHGAGPFVTENSDTRFVELVPEKHNGDNPWQGSFRVGPLDFVALKYGITLSKVDVFSLTHMDYIPKDGNWEMVLSYKYKDSSVSAAELSEYFELEQRQNDIVIRAIKPHKLSAKLTHHISLCVPFEVVNLQDFITPKISDADEEGETKAKVAKALAGFIFAQTGVKVHILSYGPSAKHKHFTS